MLREGVYGGSMIPARICGDCEMPAVPMERPWLSLVVPVCCTRRDRVEEVRKQRTVKHDDFPAI